MKFVVKVEYVDNPGLKYDFFCNIEDIQKGDIVVARSMHGLGICRVLQTHIASTKASKWIISKVDEQGHNERLSRDIKQQQLIQGMRDRVETMEESWIFQAIAQVDGEMSHMLNEWSGLEFKKRGSC